MTEEVNQPEAQVESQPQESIGTLLEKLGGPSSAEIDTWKAQYGEVFVSAFSREEVYVWRPLRRNEFRSLQLDMANPEKRMDQFDYEEAIAITCTLWPKLSSEYFAKGKGGTATSLTEQIMQNSNFFTPQQAAAFVMKL